MRVRGVVGNRLILGQKRRLQKRRKRGMEAQRGCCSQVTTSHDPTGDLQVYITTH
jgi:hypothetical protein